MNKNLKRWKLIIINAKYMWCLLREPKPEQTAACSFKKKTLTLCSSELHKLTSLQLQTYYTFIQFSTEHHSVFTQLVRVTNHWGREAKLSWWKQKWIFSQDFFACSDLRASGGRICNVFPLSLKGNVTMLICIFIVSCSRSVVSLKLICRLFVADKWTRERQKIFSLHPSVVCLN